MKRAMLILSSMFILTLIGCGEEVKKEEVKTVEWYKEHEIERKAQIEKCNNNPGELNITPNCINARSAQSELTFWSNKKRTKILEPIK